MDTDSITQYDLPEEREFEVAEDVVKISEKKSKFDVHSDMCEENGKDNSALELEEGTQEKCGSTI